MGRIGKILEYLRGEFFDQVKIDIGGGNNSTAQIFTPVGDDSQPLLTDLAISISVPQSGRRIVVAWVDQKNPNISEPGARRSYSRDPDSGDIVAEIILGNDGTITMKNEKVTQTIAADGSASLTNKDGSFAMEAGGNVVINGVTIDTDGNIDSPATVTAATDVVGGGVSLKDHTHDYIDSVDGSPTTKTTDAPNA